MNVDAAKILEQITETLRPIFQKGTRYQAEKIGIVASYVLIVIMTAVWALSSPSSMNELGAKFGHESLEQIGQQLFFLENLGSKDWTEVRIALDRKYLYTVDRVPAGTKLTLRPENFEYFFYVPRPWGQSDWEQLEKKPRPGTTAPSNIRPEFLQIRAAQGRFDMKLNEGK